MNSLLKLMLNPISPVWNKIAGTAPDAESSKHHGIKEYATYCMFLITPSAKGVSQSLTDLHNLHAKKAVTPTTMILSIAKTIAYLILPKSKVYNSPFPDNLMVFPSKLASVNETDAPSSPAVNLPANAS